MDKDLRKMITTAATYPGLVGIDLSNVHRFLANNNETVAASAKAVGEAKATRRMGERSATHRFFRAGNRSMGNVALTHPTVRPLLERPVILINKWIERKAV